MKNGRLTQRERRRLEELGRLSRELELLERKLLRRLRLAQGAGHSLRTLAIATGIPRQTLSRRLAGDDGTSPNPTGKKEAPAK